MICGLFIDDDCRAHMCLRDPDGARREEIADGFRPFMWAKGVPMAQGMEAVPLAGEGELCNLLLFSRMDVFRQAAADRSLGAEVIRPVEAQYLMHAKERFFDGMTLSQLWRVTLDAAIECAGDEPDPECAAHRVSAIGIVKPDGATEILEPADASPQGERDLLERFGKLLARLDPDVIEGHGIYDGALGFLIGRARRYHMPVAWGRFGRDAVARKSKMRIAERWIDYRRCDVPGRSVFDTFLAVQLYDISQRELPGYELDEVAEYFGATGDEGDAPADDVTLSARMALERRLKLARAVSDTLLPTYFAQAQNIPLPLQEACLRGSSSKVDSLLFERYYHARHALPDYPQSAPFEGAFSHSFEKGVYHEVLHYDVASLYPSLLLNIGRAPQGDALNVFIPLLRELRTLRLEYKKMEKEATTGELRTQYGARQRSFKILINSFYGYLGFPQARFADPALAAEITRRGRELIQSLIAEFQRLGCKVLEADTDGIYLASDEFWADPEALLVKVAHLLPTGVNLEFDGRYASMFCYKAKNYALYDGEKIHICGSAFRSRGTEPFLKALTRHLVRTMLGAENQPVGELVATCRARIVSGKMDVRELARSEYLSMSPDAYRKKMDEGGKPRRASLEVALRMRPAPRMGERVSYYIVPKTRGQSGDWQRARMLEEYDPLSAPYCPDYYVKKLDEWTDRFAQFVETGGLKQDELAL
jgi:DNA polymerase, archaea type